MVRRALLLLAAIGALGALLAGPAIASGAAPAEAQDRVGASDQDLGERAGGRSSDLPAKRLVPTANSGQIASAYLVAANNARNAANGPRLSAQLTREEAGAVFTRSGGLKPEVVAGSRAIIPGSKFKNPAVVRELTADGSNIADWAKFSTQSFKSPSGPFQVHFYRNQSTGAVNYNLDYKTVFNRGAGR